MALVRCLRLTGLPILQQLQLEEALLRSTSHNWLLINDGTPKATIVMGISGCADVAVAFCVALIHSGCLMTVCFVRQVPELVDVQQAQQQQLQLIKRFTGGGTVVVDADTIFTTLIMQVCYMERHHL
jgi:lipoate-protein ligase A